MNFASESPPPSIPLGWQGVPASSDSSLVETVSPGVHVHRAGVAFPFWSRTAVVDTDTPGSALQSGTNVGGGDSVTHASPRFHLDTLLLEDLSWNKQGGFLFFGHSCNARSSEPWAERRENR